MDYNPKLCSELTRQMAAGLSDTEVIAKWGLARSTFYRWKKEHPEFKEAHEIGKGMFDAIHIELGTKAMKKEIDLEYVYWKDLGKYCHGWADKGATGTTNNTQINIDQMNVLNEQSNEELLMYIKDNLSKHPELSRIIEHDPE